MNVAPLTGPSAPMPALFAIRCLPTQPRQALPVLALQTGAAFAALFHVWWFQW
jgi:hypothetical protein